MRRSAPGSRMRHSMVPPHVSDPRRPGRSTAGPPTPGGTLNGRMTSTRPPPRFVRAVVGRSALLRRRRRRRPRRRPGAADRRGAAPPSPGPARSSRSWPPAPTPAYGISTGFGALATRHIPTEMRAQLQRSLVRSHAAGSGPEVEREVVRGLMLLRLSTLATGRTGVRPVMAELIAALLNAGITPVVHEYGSLGCSGDLAPLSHCALALMGEGDVRDAAGTLMPAAEALAAAGLDAGRAGRQGGPGADQRHRRHARDAGAGADRPGGADAYGGHRRRHVGRGPARHRPGLRRRAPGDPAAPRPGRLGRQPGRDPQGLRRRRLPPRTRTATGSRTPTRCAARRRCTAPPATPSTTAPPSPGASWPAPSTTRWSLDDGPGRVQRQLPRRPGRLRARLRRDRRRRRRLDQRAAYRPVPRQGPQPRAAAVPRRTTPASTAAT